MVRFAVGLTGARIGFHAIPRCLGGIAIQTESRLGRAIGAGGWVRQTFATPGGSTAGRASATRWSCCAEPYTGDRAQPVRPRLRPREGQ